VRVKGRRILVSGRVQGVFFRNWTIAQAEELGLTGWVRNRADARVEIQTYGDEAAMQALIERCHQGPRAAQVESVDVEKIEGEALAAFTRAATT
jgi:acylphosphatase